MIKTVFVILSAVLIIFLQSTATASVPISGYDSETAVEAIYSNLSILKRTIRDMKGRISDNRSRLSEYHRLIKISETSIKENSNRIEQIRSEFKSLEVDYKTVLEQIILFKEYLARLELRIDDLALRFDKLRREFDLLRIEYDELKNEFDKIPAIMFMPDAKPRFSIAASRSQYLALGAEFLKIDPAFDFELTYNLGNNWAFWLNYNSPFIMTLTSRTSDNQSISDRWTTDIISFGTLRDFESWDENILFRLGLGMFYGNAQFDEFANSTVQFRNGIRDNRTMGMNLKTEIAYNEFDQKNTLELFVGINSMISFNSIIIDPGIAKEHDLGYVMIRLSVGVRFNFWGI